MKMRPVRCGWEPTRRASLSIMKVSSNSGIADVGDINCVEDGGGDIVWVGTNDRGLIRWNSVTDERMFFRIRQIPALSRVMS